MSSGELTDLQQKVAALPTASWRKNAHDALFSASGFDRALTARAKAEGVLLVDTTRLLTERCCGFRAIPISHSA